MCTQCNFMSQFESALMMHRQLHHGSNDDSIKEKFEPLKVKQVLTMGVDKEKATTLPLMSSLNPECSKKNKKGFQLGRTSSATRLFEKLKARISKSRSRTMFPHPEEADTSIDIHDLTAMSECTSKGMNLENATSKSNAATGVLDQMPSLLESPVKESFGCHLCSFDADRITVLDRHLLNYHKIGLENLLKLVMAKTKDGLSDEPTNVAIYGVRQPYYKPPDEIIEDGEFVIETVTPKINILKHAATNTDLKWTDIPNIKDNCRIITKEIQKLMKYPLEMTDKEAFLNKMENLNDCMCKFVDSSNTLKKVLNKEYDSRISVRQEREEPLFNLGLGDQDSPRDWERAHSEKAERSKHKYRDNCRIDKSKLTSESFYF